MRGGALPILAWGTLLVILLAINWIWTGSAIQVGQFGFAALAIFGSGVALILTRREAARRGAPSPEVQPQALPLASMGSVMAGLSVGCILFGLVWGRFLMFFGAGLLMASLGRLVIEKRSERASRLVFDEERMK